MQLSHHANERLSERNISESELFELERYGARWADPADDSIFYARLGDLFAVFHGHDNWLITAYRLGN